MELALQEKDNHTLEADIIGEFSFSDNTKFREILKQVVSKQPQNVVVDFSNTTFIDSAALGMLLLLKEQAEQLKAKVELRGSSGQVRKVLELSRYQDLFIMDQPGPSAA